MKKHRGRGMRNLEDVPKRQMDSYGLSKSRWSDLFVRHCGEILEGFLNRRLDEATYVALFIESKVIRGQSLLVATGVTARGEKRRRPRRDPALSAPHDADRTGLPVR